MAKAETHRIDFGGQSGKNFHRRLNKRRLKVKPALHGGVLWGLLFLQLFSTISSAQTLHLRNYSTDDGLPSSQVWRILQDSQGYIWFGTSNGLARYDGREMTTFNAGDGLVSNVVLAMVEDAGRLWIATDNGISRYHDGAFESFSRLDGKELGIVWSVASFGGYIWFGTKAQGLLRVDPRRDDNGHFTMEIVVPDGLKPENSVFALAPAKDGLWIATARSQLYRYDGSRFLECAKVFGLEKETLTNVLRSGDSTLWVGTSKHGVFRCDLNALEGKGRSASAERYFPNAYIYSSTQNGDEMLFGTRHGGLVSLQHEQKDKVTVENGLCDNQIYSILVDREGSVWLGTNRGVAKILSKKFRGYLKDEIITSTCEYRNSFWFGTFENGLIRLKNGEITRFTTKNGLISDDQIFSIVVFQGELWIGSFGGLSSYDGAAFHAHVGKSPSETPTGISSLYPAGDRLWIGTVNWAWMYRKAASKDRFTLLSDTNKPNLTYFQAVTEDQEHRIWFGSPSGAYIYDPKHPREGMKNVGISDGLPVGCINCIFRDSEGSLWLGTQTGLIKYQPKKKERFKLFSFAVTEDGSASYDSNVFSIIQSSEHYWIATSMGIAEFDGEKFLRRYTKREGLIGNEATSASSLYRDSRGHVWFATYSGVTEYLPENDIPNTVPPPILIEKAYLDKTPIREGHSFAYRRSTVRFGFVGLSFKDEKDVRYKYTLVGYDQEWSEITEKREVRYTNLASGRYVFKVMARNADGCWSATPATVAFEILPPYWGKWWFLLLAGIAVALLIRAGFGLRLKRIKREKRRLEKLVAEKTKMLTVQAITDGLTGAHNRRWFMQKLRQEIISMARRPSPDWISLIILDIDQFKDLNDTYGHLAGDYALTSLVEVLRGCLRENDTLARYGGDEFATILPSTSAEGARVVSEKMREAIEFHSFRYKGHRLKVVISIGVAVWQCSRKLQSDIIEELIEKLVTETDAAMYEAKKKGGNRVALRLLQP